jgi:hypothetical protein
VSASARRVGLGSLQPFSKLLRCDFDFTKDLAEQRAGNVSSRVMRHCRRPAVRMAIKHVTARLPNGVEA